LKANHNAFTSDISNPCLVDSTTNLKKKKMKANHNLYVVGCDSTTNLKKKNNFESKSQLELRFYHLKKKLMLFCLNVVLRFYYKSKKKEQF
jgi:hypothetical protein